MKQRFVLKGCPEGLVPNTTHNVRVVSVQFDGTELVTTAIYIGGESDTDTTVHRQDPSTEGSTEHKET